MPEIWCVRADFGKYAEAFKKGAYTAIGWFRDIDLSDIADKDGIRQIYPQHHPQDTSPYVIGAQVGQISRFLFDIKPDDFILLPTTNTEFVYWGQMKDEPYHYVQSPTDGCPFQHRRSASWNSEPVRRSLFSVPLQNTMRSSLTVFWVSQKASFFESIGRNDLVPPEFQTRQRAAEVSLERVLTLDDLEFELLVTNLLTAMGFEAEHKGRVGDGGVDATGEMDIYNVAKIRLYVQAKRYKRGARIGANTVKALRQSIPKDAYGAFITTADFQAKALETATEPGFPRIGTINGEQLVDLLAEKWEYLDPDIRAKLGLKRGLVLE